MPLLVINTVSTVSFNSPDEIDLTICSEEKYQEFLKYVDLAFEDLSQYNKKNKKEKELVIFGYHESQDRPFKTKEKFLEQFKVKTVSKEEAYFLIETLEMRGDYYMENVFQLGGNIAWYTMFQTYDWTKSFK